LKDKKNGILVKPYKFPKFKASSKKLIEEEIIKERREHTLKYQTESNEYDEMKKIIQEIEEREILKDSQKKETEQEVKEKLIAIGEERAKIKRQRYSESQKLALEERSFKSSLKNALLGCNLALLVNLRQQQFLLSNDSAEKEILNNELASNYKILGTCLENTIKLCSETLSTPTNPETTSVSTKGGSTQQATPILSQLNILSNMANRILETSQTESSELQGMVCDDSADNDEDNCDSDDNNDGIDCIDDNDDSKDNECN